MSEHVFPLAPFYKGWDGYQQHLVDVLAPLSNEQLALRPAPHLRSVSIIAAHIVGARARWMYYVLQEKDESILPLRIWDREDQPARSASEFVSGLQTTWKLLQASLQRWTNADLEEILYDTDEDGGQVETFTRQWVIWHLIEHDLHHGGEISFTLGMHNLAAIDL